MSIQDASDSLPASPQGDTAAGNGHSSYDVVQSDDPEQPVAGSPEKYVSLKWPTSAASHRRRRFLLTCALSACLGPLAVVIAWLMLMAINLITGLTFQGVLTTAHAEPAHNHLGLWVIAIPTIGGFIVGLFARYGTRAIRGHGIPEAMEQILTNQSRVSPRVLILKPIASAIAIGTGGPFGAEGPIIATGGALGSFIGQVISVTPHERKTLLAAGAAAGMTAIFGTPVAAVLLAVELLLFELRASSLIPVALACASAAGIGRVMGDGHPIFAVNLAHTVAVASPSAMIFYALLGLLMGVISMGVTHVVYAVEDAFEKLPVHFMWWPALGGLGVGVCGYFAPHTLGVGYDNILNTLNGQIVGWSLAVLVLAQFFSWSIALGSGTSGGTLAPLLTLGGGMGLLLGNLGQYLMPEAHISLTLAALVGLASLFAGTSRAWLAAVAFALESSGQVGALAPLLAGCAMSQVVAEISDLPTIMTKKIVRRGVVVSAEFVTDSWANVPVAEAMSAPVVTVKAGQTPGEALRHITTLCHGSLYRGFPVVDDIGRLCGVVTRHELEEAAAKSADGSEGSIHQIMKRGPVVVSPRSSLREASEHMVRHHVSRLVVVSEGDSSHVVGILTNGDALRYKVDMARENYEVQAISRGPLRPRGIETADPAENKPRHEEVLS